MNDLLKDLFYQKRVALVGPAKYMEHLEAGSDIDNCDTVVRINRSWESIVNYSKNIGNRTDVLYSCLIEKPANAGEIDVQKYQNQGIKLICAPPASDMKGIAQTTSLHGLVNIEKVKQLNEKIPVRIVDHYFHTELALQVNCRPNTGFMAIYDILRFKPSSLNIYGFSFYLDGFVKGVKEGIIEEQKKTEEEFANQCFNSKRHVQKNMWLYAKSTLLNHPSVNVDNHLRTILNLEKLEKGLFKVEK